MVEIFIEKRWRMYTHILCFRVGITFLIYFRVKCPLMHATFIEWWIHLGVKKPSFTPPYTRQFLGHAIGGLQLHPIGLDPRTSRGIVRNRAIT